MAQTGLQQALLDEMKRLVAFLQKGTDVGIRAGVIRATNVINGTQIIYQWPGALPGGGDALWESHYLRTLLAQCDALDLAAVDETYLPDDGGALHLRDVFTPLHLQWRGQLVTQRPGESAAKAIQRLFQQEKAPAKREQALEKEDKSTPIPAVAAAAALPRLVILGYPGGGKSTLVNYLAAQLAARRLGQAQADDLPGWPDDARPLPVRIILRRFAAALPNRVLPDERAGLVWGYIEKQMADWGCAESFAPLKQTLLAEGGVILFDGLDEVRETDADSRRSLIKEAIVAFAAPLENCRVIVTCRDYAYEGDAEWRLPESQFPIFSLPLFGSSQPPEATAKP